MMIWNGKKPPSLVRPKSPKIVLGMDTVTPLDTTRPMPAYSDCVPSVASMDGTLR